MVVTEAVARNFPGVVGHEHALDDETFSHNLDYIEYPQYTRPEEIKLETRNSKFKTLKVPSVLLSGNHQKIKNWRQKLAKKRKI